MTDVLTRAQRRSNMAAIHSASTMPEINLRRSLWHRKFRYRVNVKRLPGSPDIVLPKYRSVIFVHGCFWHGHKDCKNYTVPKTNTEFWVAKVARNRERDQAVWRKLEALGWKVIIVWECQLKKTNIEDTMERVVSELQHNREVFLVDKESRREARKEYLLIQKAKKENRISMKREVRDM